MKKIKRDFIFKQGNSGTPLIIILCAVHGNEPAGYLAAKNVISQLPSSNDFSIVGILGNIQAFHSNKRYIDQDLNRIWNIPSTPNTKNIIEFSEREEIIKTVKSWVAKTKAKEVYFVDIHSTSASGTFIIPSEHNNGIELLQYIGFPIVNGLLKGIQGTTIQFWQNQTFFDCPFYVFGVEAGQHQDPETIKNAIKVIEKMIEYVTDKKPQLPLCSTATYSLTYTHLIKENDNFVMKPGFQNFDYIEKGKTLAIHNNKEIPCPEDCYILMPLYQKQGSEGFFLLRLQDLSMGQ